MMASLFFVLTIALFFIYTGMRKTGITILIIGLFLCIFMFSYHMTDPLKVNL